MLADLDGDRRVGYRYAKLLRIIVEVKRLTAGDVFQLLWPMHDIDRLYPAMAAVV